MLDTYRLSYAQMNALLRELRRIYKNDDEREFMQILHKYGVKDEDPRFAEIVKFLRDLRGGKT